MTAPLPAHNPSVPLAVHTSRPLECQISLCVSVSQTHEPYGTLSSDWPRSRPVSTVAPPLPTKKDCLSSLLSFPLVLAGSTDVPTLHLCPTPHSPGTIPDFQ